MLRGPRRSLRSRVLGSGGTVVELIAYEDASVEPAPQKEHLGYRVIALEVDDMQKALAAGQCVPWHYHTEISDSFVCLEGPMVVETRAERDVGLPLSPCRASAR